MGKWIACMLIAACVAVGCSVPEAVHGAAASGSLAVANSDWTVYHHDVGGSGADMSGVGFTSPTLAWNSPTLDGSVYGAPLEATGRVFVATENDTVYALAANTGAVLWSDHLGTPVPSGDLPCGDISPTVGITSTPVIDTTLGEIFVVTDEMVAGQPMHRLWGLNMYNGGTLLQPIPVDPPGQNPLNVLNRASLTLDNGHVVFGYGGNDGDCATYHGWVVSVPENGGRPAYFEVDATASGQRMGAVWMGGAAPIVDSSGNIWIATGNGSTTSSSQPYDNSDGVLELSPTPDWCKEESIPCGHCWKRRRLIPKEKGNCCISCRRIQSIEGSSPNRPDESTRNDWGTARTCCSLPEDGCTGRIERSLHCSDSSHAWDIDSRARDSIPAINVCTLAD